MIEAIRNIIGLSSGSEEILVACACVLVCVFTVCFLGIFKKALAAFFRV